MFLKYSNQQLAYHFTRIAIGLSIFVHGAVRFPILRQFAESHLKMFEHTLIAGYPALIMCYIIPFLEAGSGLIILSGGRRTRYGLLLGIATMGILMFGVCLAQKFNLVISMLLHVIVFYLLLLSKYTPEARQVTS